MFFHSSGQIVSRCRLLNAWLYLRVEANGAAAPQYIFTVSALTWTV